MYRDSVLVTALHTVCHSMSGCHDMPDRHIVINAYVVMHKLEIKALPSCCHFISKLTTG